MLYVSNINGDGGAKDGNGYITQVSPEGKVLKKEWIGDLHAPKGMALRDNKLYVADVDQLIEIDVITAQISKRYPAKGATFLNNVAIDLQGNVYTSDSRSTTPTTIYKLSEGTLSAWLSNPAVKMTNGLHSETAFLIAAAGDSTAENPSNARYLQTIHLKTKEVNPLTNATPLGNIDAIEADGHGGYFLSDWAAGKVLHFTPAQGAKLILQPGDGTADLDYIAKTQMLYLPIMLSHELAAYRVIWEQ